jgi:hypothetical protein
MQTRRGLFGARCGGLGICVVSNLTRHAVTEGKQWQLFVSFDCWVRYLSRYTMTLDIAKHRLFIGKGKQFNRITVQRPNLGFTVIAVDGQRVVSDVEESGVGYKRGIRLEDRILAIDGQGAADLSLYDLKRHLRSGIDGVRLKVSGPDGANIREILLPSNHE